MCASVLMRWACCRSFLHSMVKNKTKYGKIIKLMASERKSERENTQILAIGFYGNYFFSLLRFG
jgi:hypothetical protein